MLFFPFLLFFAWGCNSCLGAESSPEKDGSKVPASCLQEMPRPEPQKLDILFVIDHSGSMIEEQGKVRDELTTFMNELRQTGGIDQSMHIGVINTSVYYFEKGASGPAYGNVGYGVFPGGRLLPVLTGLDFADAQKQSQRVLRSDQEGFVDAFKLRIAQGTEGSPQETPFEAVRLALLSELSQQPLSEGGNKGFLRDGARLLIVVLSDEDDCSENTGEEGRPRVQTGLDNSVNYCREASEQLTSVEEYFELFSNLVDSHGRHREVVWTAIAPVSIGEKVAEETRLSCEESLICNEGCPTSMAAGFRHREMAEKFDPSLQNLNSICEDSYRETLIRIANMANVPQYVDLKNIPNKELVQITLTRADGLSKICTLHNGGIAYWEEGGGMRPDRVYFSEQCPRYPSDLKVEVALFCVS